MTENLKQQLKDIGVEYDALVERFMNMDKMAEKFLVKFLSDPTMEEYRCAVENDDAQAIFKATHTLKGLCGNLCVKCMNDIITPAVEIYRNGSTDGAKETYAKVKAEYDKVCEVIKQI